MQYDKGGWKKLVLRYLYMDTELKLRTDISNIIHKAGKSYQADGSNLVCKIVSTYGAFYEYPYMDDVQGILTSDIYRPHRLIKLNHEDHIKFSILEARLDKLLDEMGLISNLITRAMNRYDHFEDIVAILPNSISGMYKKIPPEIYQTILEQPISESTVQFKIDNKDLINAVNVRVLTNLVTK